MPLLRLAGVITCCCLLLPAGCSGSAVDNGTPPVLTALDDAREAAADAELRKKLDDARAQQAASEPSATAPADVSGSGTYRVRFETTAGSFVVAVNREWAPLGAEKFHELVSAGFYNDAGFFRVVPGFMVQFGIAADPAVHAKWDSNITDDPVIESNQRGFVTFAQTGAPNSRSTQVFVNYTDNSFLDSQGFAPFGRVVEGMDVVDRISAAHREEPDQGRITGQGNAYLKSSFPQLDYIKSAAIIDENGETVE